MTSEQGVGAGEFVEGVLPAAIIPYLIPAGTEVEPSRRRLKRELMAAEYEEAAYSDPPAHLRGDSRRAWKRHQGCLRSHLVRVGGAGPRHDHLAIPLAQSMGMRWGTVAMEQRFGAEGRGRWHTRVTPPPGYGFGSRDESPPRTQSRRGRSECEIDLWWVPGHWTYARALGQSGNHLCEAACEEQGRPEGRCMDQSCVLCSLQAPSLSYALSRMREIEQWASGNPPPSGSS